MADVPVTPWGDPVRRDSLLPSSIDRVDGDDFRSLGVVGFGERGSQARSTTRPESGSSEKTFEK